MLETILKNQIETLLNSGSSRQSLISAISDPTRYHLFINTATTYRCIESHLNKNYQQLPVTIHQTEEDWFERENYFETRNKIKNHTLWNDQSYIITNSRQDKEKTIDMGISAVCRPGILDLICYRPYNTEIVTMDNITMHTGVLWYSYRPHRERVWQLLNKYKNKVSVAKLSQQWEHNSLTRQFLILNTNKNFTDTPQIFDAPWQNINDDLWWSACSAFGTVSETRHQSLNFDNNGMNPSNHYGKLSKINYDKLLTFTPTTSEKTYRNMHLLRPAVVHGGHNTRQYLKDLGFDTWDWFVDWSFDAEADDNLRFNKFLNEVERLLNTPIHQLIKLIDNNRDKLLYNRDRLFWLINNYDTIDI